MGEFRSTLFNHLAAAAEIPYNPNLPAAEVVYRAVDPDGQVVQYINDDQKRMDAMKTAFMKLILLRARNYMIQQNEDVKDLKDRVSKVSLLISFDDETVDHRDGSQLKTKFFDREAIKQAAKEKIVLGGGDPAVTVDRSNLDAIDGAADLEIITLLMNFLGDVEAVVKKPRLVWNCPKPTS